jgi:hypothetical protein
MKTDTLQDPLEKYRQKIAGSTRNSAAAYELALVRGRDYRHGEQVSYYITGTTKKIAVYENAKLGSAFDPQNRDENIVNLAYELLWRGKRAGREGEDGEERESGRLAQLPEGKAEVR